MGIFDNMMPTVPVRKCHLLHKAEQLGLAESDIKTLFAMVDDRKTWSSGALTRSLCDRGFVISRGVIDRHRNGECPCKAA